MTRREEGEYSTYLTDEQRRQRAKDQARREHYAPVRARALALHGKRKQIAYLVGRESFPLPWPGRIRSARRVGLVPAAKAA
jgi:hypothetical protein